MLSELRVYFSTFPSLKVHKFPANGIVCLPSLMLNACAFEKSFQHFFLRRLDVFSLAKKERKSLREGAETKRKQFIQNKLATTKQPEVEGTGLLTYTGAALLPIGSLISFSRVRREICLLFLPTIV